MRRALAALLLLAACAPDAPLLLIRELLADAGADVAVATGEPLVLDGTRSDGRGYVLSFHWRIATRPSGSAAALSSTGDARPVLVPDVDGSYVVELVVSAGGINSDPDRVTILATTPRPTPTLGGDFSARKVYVGEPVAVDPVARDPAGGELSFQWTLELRPPGSAATVVAPSAAELTFVPDVAGDYRLSLLVSSDITSVTRTVAINVQPPARELPYGLLAAAHSDALDAVIVASHSPSLLTVIDAAGDVARTIALALPPTALALAPDGLSAAVGHDGAISVVRLDSGELERIVHVSADVAAVALPGNGYAYAFPASSGAFTRVVHSVRLADEDEVLTESSPFDTPRQVVVHPAGDRLYAPVSTYPSSVERYELLDGPATPTPVASWFDGGCTGLWIAGDGARLYTSCGSVLRVSAAASTDLAVLSNRLSTTPLSWVHHPAGATKLVVAPARGFEQTAAAAFRVHDAATLAPERSGTPRDLRIDGVWHPCDTPYVFLAADGRVAVIVQARNGDQPLSRFALFVETP